MLNWLRKLTAPSETPLNRVATQDMTVEDLVSALQRVQRDNAEMRSEWGEVLDKLTRLAGRQNARLRGRARMALDREELEDQEPVAPAPPKDFVPPDFSAPQLEFDPRDKASVRAFVLRNNARKA